MDRFIIDFEWIDELKQNPTLIVDLSDSTEVAYYAMTEAGPLASPEARQAMCYAFPYQEVIDGVLQGLRIAGQQPDRTVGAWLSGERVLLRDRPRQGPRAPGGGRYRRGDRAD